VQITPNIFIAGGPSISHPSDAYIYLIKSQHGSALIDSGTGKAFDKILKNIKGFGVNPSEIKYLFLTHCHYDHTGGAEKIREHTGCEIVAHNMAADYLEAGDTQVTAASWYGENIKPLKIDIKIHTDRDEFYLDEMKINFYHTPGHSPGSSVYTVNSDGKLILFGQDVHGPLDSTLRSDNRDYIKSLNFLLSLNADILCEGHFGIYHGKDEVKKFIKSFL